MRKFNVSKTIAAALAAALVTMSLTACGSSATTAASTEAASTAASESSSEEAVTEDEEVTEVEADDLESEDISEEESTDADLATDEEEDLADDEDNTDITAGTTDEDGNYSAYAILNGKVDANVTALASDIKTDDFSSSKAVGDTGSDSIKDARLSYLTEENDGDEEAANDDLEDYDDVEAATDAQLKEIKNYAEDLGKLFTQFDITAYDFSSPYDSDSDYVEYDVYSSSGTRFLLDFTFSDGTLTSIDFSEDED